MIDAILKITQTGFYIVGATIAVLTYRAAKKGLLNTVNTEFHKRVIETLSTINDELYSEFDMTSDRYWGKDNNGGEFFRRLNEEIQRNRHEIITRSEGDFPIGIPVTKLQVRLQGLIAKYRADPFIPEVIRVSVLRLIQGRLSASHESNEFAAREYVRYLSSADRWRNLEGNEGWVLNRENGRMYELGFGLSQVELKVDEIRTAMQLYFSGFDPLTKSIVWQLPNSYQKLKLIVARLIKGRPW